MLTMGEFVAMVLRLKDPDAALQFYEQQVQQMREQHPEQKDPEGVVRSNIGWCFGEGMSIPCRKMWTAVVGAEHPAFGRMEQDPTPQEAFQAGQDAMKDHFERSRRTSWQLLMKDT
jgi:hypothetical protein